MIAFLEALNQLSLDYMEKVMTSDTLTIEGMNIDGKNKLFGLTRMLDTIRVNLFRLNIFWDLAVAHFVCIAHSKNQVLRSHGVENLSQMIQNSFNFILKSKEVASAGLPKEENKSNEESTEHSTQLQIQKVLSTDKFNGDDWQQVLFQPWLDICDSKFPDTKETILSSILKMLQSSGHEVNKGGWQVLLKILHDISVENYSGTNSVTGNTNITIDRSY